MPVRISCNRHGISSPGRRDFGGSDPSVASLRLSRDDCAVPNRWHESEDPGTRWPSILRRTTSQQSRLIPRRLRQRPSRGRGPRDARYSQGLDQSSCGPSGLPSSVDRGSARASVRTRPSRAGTQDVRGIDRAGEPGVRGVLPVPGIRDPAHPLRAKETSRERLGEDLQFLPDFLVGGERFVEVLAPQACVHDVSDAGPVLRHHRIHDRQGEDAFFEQAGTQPVRRRWIAEHHRRDRRLAPSDVEPHRDQAFLEGLRVGPELLHVAGLRLEDVDRRGAGCGNGRRMRTAQQPRPRLVEGVVPQVVRPRDVSADDAQGLRERPELDLDLVLDLEVGRDAAASIAENALAVRVVDVDHGAEFLTDPRDVPDRRDVAVHREHAIGADEDLLRPTVDFFEGPLEIPDVAMSVDHALRLRQADAVDDASVVQLVRQDRIPFSGELRDESRVPREAAHEEQRRLPTFEAGDPPLEFLVEIHVARDRPDAPTPGAVGLDGLPSGPLDLRMVREVQVVVRTEHDHALAVHHAPRRRRSLEDAEPPVQALGYERLVLLAHPPGRVPLRHHQTSIGKATLPQFPLRITPIASLYSSSGNLWVRIGFRFTFPLFRSPPICIHVLYIRRPWIPYIDSPFVTNSEMSRLSGFGKSPSRWIPPAGRTTRIACWTAASLPENSSTSSTPSPAVASITSSRRDSPDRSTRVAPTFLARSIRYWFLWPIAMTVRAAMARQRATAISPIGPSPKTAIVFPGTFAFVTV